MISLDRFWKWIYFGLGIFLVPSFYFALSNSEWVSSLFFIIAIVGCWLSFNIRGASAENENGQSTERLKRLSYVERVIWSFAMGILSSLLIIQDKRVFLFLPIVYLISTILSNPYNQKE